MKLLAKIVALFVAAAPCACRSSSTTPSGTSAITRAPRDYGYPMDNVLRMNHAQSKGTHNSYHVETPGNTQPEWHYSHLPLDQQASSQGVRAFELDTHYIARDDRFEVFHIGLLDEGTTCRKFTECLAVLKGWSDRFPAHEPLLVMIEPKDTPADDGAEAYFATLEAEIRSVWPRERIITPDDVTGSAPTLRDAVTTNGWPTLAQVRGNVLFFLNDADAFRRLYSRGGTSLAGRIFFTQADSRDEPLAAVFVLNDPVNDRANIDAAVKAGFLVRTFSDTSGDVVPATQAAALAGGAHVISTDFPVPTAGAAADGGTYSLDVPSGTPSRCNPLLAPPGCTPAAIEDPARLAVSPR